MLLAVIYGLFVVFTVMDFTQGDVFWPNLCKFMAVVLCFVLSNVGEAASACDRRLLQAGMLLTVFSDLCMLILDKEWVGVLSFCLVQIIYTVRYGERKAAAFLLLVYLVYVPIVGIHERNVVYTSAFYFVCILTSVASSFRAFRRKTLGSPQEVLVCVGMVLFLLCDICVGLYNVPHYGQNQKTMHIVSVWAFHLIWVFYLNAQVLLALSGRRWKTT